MLSGGYFGFRFVKQPPLQCVERFDLCHSNEKNIIASLLKFAAYIHNNKIFPGNIFVLVLKKKMADRDVYSTLSKDFCWPCRAIRRICSSLQNLDWEYFWPHFQKTRWLLQAILCQS